MKQEKTSDPARLRSARSHLATALAPRPQGSISAGDNVKLDSSVRASRSKETANIASNYYVPAFYDGARGTPNHWNYGPKPVYWGEKVYKRFPPVPGAVVDPQRIVEFLSLRFGPDGKPVSEKIGPPEQFEQGWFRFPWLGFVEDDLPAESSTGKRTQWEIAWHGCKVEALYSILYSGFLASSCDVEQGHRYFQDAPGIYVHKECTAHKADNYVRFTPLCEDGVFWAAKWEVRVDRSERVEKKDTDQWTQRDGSVRLVAL